MNVTIASDSDDDDDYDDNNNNHNDNKLSDKVNAVKNNNTNIILQLLGNYHYL